MSFQALPEEEAAGRCLQELHQFPALFYLSALQLPTLLPEYTGGPPDSPSNSLHGHAFCEVAGFVDVTAA
jgi:hypothetical protein